MQGRTEGHRRASCFARRRKTERELELARQQMQDVMQSATAAREARDEAHNMMASMQAEQDRQAKAYDRALGQMQTIVERDRNLMEIERQRQLAVAGAAQVATGMAWRGIRRCLAAEALQGFVVVNRRARGGHDAPRAAHPGQDALNAQQLDGVGRAQEPHGRGQRRVQDAVVPGRALGHPERHGDGGGGGVFGGKRPSDVAWTSRNKKNVRGSEIAAPAPPPQEFSRMEERNFNMFNLQRELDAEVEALEERLGGIRDEAQRLRQQSKRNEDERRQVIASAEEQRNRAQEALTTNRQRLEESTAELKRIRVVVGDIVKVRRWLEASGTMSAGRFLELTRRTRCAGSGRQRAVDPAPAEARGPAGRVRARARRVGWRGDRVERDALHGGGGAACV